MFILSVVQTCMASTARYVFPLLVRNSQQQGNVQETEISDHLMSNHVQNLLLPVFSLRVRTRLLCNSCSAQWEKHQIRSFTRGNLICSCHYTSNFKQYYNNYPNLDRNVRRTRSFERISVSRLCASCQMQPFRVMINLKTTIYGHKHFETRLPNNPWGRA